MTAMPKPSAVPHPFGDTLGLRLASCGDGESECRLSVREALLNPHGVLHGAVLCAMADTGMGAALYSVLAEGESCATSQLSVSFVAPVRGGEVVCRSRVVSKGSRAATLESTLERGGAVVAKALGTFAVLGAITRPRARGR